MPSVAIMGAGPIGFYTAIMLKKQYPDLDVRVFDKNAHRYARPGVIAEMALTTINNSFEKMSIPPLVIDKCGGTPEAIYIRDLHRALYTKAHEFGVTIIPENYFGLDTTDQSLITQHPSGSQNKQPSCDLLIDCTGERRAVMSYFQQATPIAINPVPNHFVAYIDMTTDNDYKLTNSLKDKAKAQGISVQELEKNILSSFENLSEFRSETGWIGFKPPKVDMRRWNKPREGGDNYTAGYCLYFETPAFSDSEEVDEETLSAKHVAYLKSLLRFYTKEDIDFRPCTEFGTFQPFTVQPMRLRQLVDNTQGFPIVALGDALMSAEYRLGTGVKNGVECAYELISSLQIDTKISVNDALWGSKIAHIIDRHTQQITNDYADPTSLVLINAYCSYKKYKSTATEPDSEVVMNSIRDLAEALKKSGHKWVSINISDEIAKQNCIDLYQKILDLANDRPEDFALVSIKTKTLSNLGKLYYKWKDFDKAASCFQEALILVEISEEAHMKASLKESLYKTDIAKFKHNGDVPNTPTYSRSKK